jgi:hypothetical protein
MPQTALTLSLRTNLVGADVRRLTSAFTMLVWSLPRNGRDGFHAVPDIPEKVWDEVERVFASAFHGAHTAAIRGSGSPYVGSCVSGSQYANGSGNFLPIRWREGVSRVGVG